MRNESLNFTIKVAVLSALAIILYFIEFPLPLFPEFLKIDFGDLPAVFGAYAIGPIAGVLIQLIKNILHFVIKGSTGGVGEFANFIVGCAFVIPAGFIYNIKKTKNTAIISLVAASLAMGIVSATANYYMFIPLYSKVLGIPIQAFADMGRAVNSSIVDIKTLVIFSILPFNLLKALMISLVTLLLYKKLSGILHS